MAARMSLNFVKDWFVVKAVVMICLVLLGYFGKRSQQKPSEKYKPQLEMVGREAVVIRPLSQSHEGLIEVEGELWLARLPGRDGVNWPVELESGTRVRIVAQQDLLLLVEPLPTEPQGWK
jgi:membrane protein implicated in regulation of membrane protease activity